MAEVELSPREYCELAKLASRGKRRVNHKAHGSIEWLQFQLWDAMIEADPEPAAFERLLFECAFELDTANGPSRALAGEIIADWRWARSSPSYVAWLRGLGDSEPWRREREPSGSGPQSANKPRAYVEPENFHGLVAVDEDLRQGTDSGR